MKKIIGIFLMFMLLMSCVISVQAVGQMAVIFTSGSSFEVGGTATVDFTKTAQTVMDDGAVTSDMYNAALERNMSVVWVCSNGSDKSGTSVTWTAADAGKEYVCRVGFYADSALTDFVDFVDSQPFTVSQGQTNVDVKITPEGPFYLTVGKAFQQKLSCNVAGVTLENFRTSFPNGIDISPDGLISGTPTKDGFWYVTIVAYKDGEQIGDIGVEFYVSAQTNEPPEITTRYLPEATVGQSYYVKLQCTDPDASFGEWYNPGKANDLSKTGLILTQHGELEGKPSKAGSYTFCISASGEGGEGYMTYTLVVKEAAQEATEPTEETTEATEETTEATEETTEATTGKGDKDKADKNKDKDKGKDPGKDTGKETGKDTNKEINKDSKTDTDTDNGNIWIYVGIGLGAALVGIIVAIVLLLKKKKA